MTSHKISERLQDSGEFKSRQHANIATVFPKTSLDNHDNWRKGPFPGAEIKLYRHPFFILIFL